MPSQKILQQRASAIARASVPTSREVTRPFHSAISDVAGYTAANEDLSRLLGANVASAYNAALEQQKQIDSAAQARLGALGTPGVAAAQGGVNDSALSNLNAQSAAAQEYQARQPSIVSSQGTLARLGLQKQMTDALQTNQDRFRQNYLSAYQQERANAQSLALSVAQMRQSASQFQQSYGLQVQQLNQSAANAAASLRERHWEFLHPQSAASSVGVSPADWAKSLAAAHAFLAPTASTAQVPIYGVKKTDTGRTDSHGQEIFTITHPITGYKQVPVKYGTNGLDYAQQGIPFAQAISDLVTQGVVPNMQAAEVAAGSLYNQYRDINRFRPGVNGETPAFRAYASFVHYMASTHPKVPQYQAALRALNKRIQSPPPVPDILR